MEWCRERLERWRGVGRVPVGGLCRERRHGICRSHWEPF